MPYFDNDGIKIYYEIEGDGPPVVFIHGFAGASEGIRNQTNFIENLKDKYRLILIDCRGHGKSDKPHDDSYYGQKMTDDVIKLMEHLSIEKANFLGYSMGASITFHLLLTKPEMIISAILGGFVITLNEKEIEKDLEDTNKVIEAFRAENIDQIKDPQARALRQFAEFRKNDLLALAAVQAGWLIDWSKIMQSPAQMKG
ncbi:MAG: alpha/beta fold hydrolase, partial [Promethearchaeota archaeon]